MTVTAGANALIIDSVIEKSIDNIDVMSVQDANGELFRKEPQSVEIISATERKYTFYFIETEAVGTLVGASLYGNGATTILGTGTEMVTEKTSIPKTGTTSLLVYWNVKVV